MLKNLLFVLSASIHLQIKTTDKLVYDAVKDLLRRAPDRKGGAGRAESMSDSPSFVVTSSSVGPAPPPQPPLHTVSQPTTLQPT